jgi:predicted nuclease of predicted toxin-antitoxin system
MKLTKIKILADENVSPKVVAYLRNIGLDILDVKEQRWFGKADADLLQIAFAEQRFVLTHDSDFGDLAMNEGKPCYGILYLRVKNLKPIHVIHVCQRLFEKDFEMVPGTILVIGDARIRMRVIEQEE